LIYYLMGNLAVNSDTAAMISPTASFRQDYDAYKAAFPQDVDNIVAVVESNIAEAAEAAVRDLAKRLAVDPSIDGISRPDGGEFFDKAGFLFLSAERLAELGDRLASAAPFLADLAAEPGLPRLLASLKQALENLEPETADSGDANQPLTRMVDQLAQLAEASAAGRASGFSWQAVAVSDSAVQAGVKDPVSMTRKLLLIQPKIDFFSLRSGKAALAKVRQVVSELPAVAGGQVHVRLTGSLALAEEEQASAIEGATQAGIISFILVTALLYWGLGVTTLAVGATVTLIVGLIWTAAFAALVVGHLNLISVTFAVLFVGLSVDFGLHFGLRYREALAGARDNASALIESADSVGPALALCALAAAISFLSFWPTEYSGLAELGLIAGGGMGVALLANLTVLPAWLAMWPATAPVIGEKSNAASAEAWVTRHARLVVMLTVGFGLLALIPAANARFDFDPINLKDPNSESVQTVRDLGADGDSTRYAAMALSPDPEQALLSAEKFKALPEVDRVITLQSFIPKDQNAKLELIGGMALFMQPVLMAEPAAAPASDPTSDPALDQAGARASAVAGFRDAVHDYRTKTANDAAGLDGPLSFAMQRFLSALEALRQAPGDVQAAGAGAGANGGLAGFEANVFAYYPQFLGRLRSLLDARPVNIDSLPEDLRSRWIAADGRAKIMIVPKADLATDLDALSEFVAAAKSVDARVTGTPVVVFEAGQVVTGSVYLAGLLSLLGITGLLLISLRSLIDTLLVLAPLLLAALLTAAAITLLGVPFNFANVIVLPLLLGLGVASGIQLVARARSGGVGLLAETSTPRAIVFSALTTIGSFGTLGLSHHFGMASLGIVLMVAISFTLLSTLVVLPALLALALRAKPAAGNATVNGNGPVDGNGLGA
jgi:hopanoid biosynthesis associated RND transporter like protein HpnN